MPCPRTFASAYSSLTKQSLKNNFSATDPKKMVKFNKRATGSLDPTRGKSTKEVKFTKTFRRLPSPIEEDASDSEMDIGRLESQQFLGITKTMEKQTASKQAETHKANFQAMVEGSKEEIVGILKENAADMLKKSADQNAAFVELLSLCCMPGNVNLVDLSSSRTSSSTKSSSHPGYSMAPSFLALSKDLIQDYDRIAHHLGIKGGSLQVGEDWENDCRRLHSVLRAGRRSTEDEAYELVTGQSRSSGKASEEGAADLEAPHVWTAFGTVEGDQQKGVRWVYAAQRAEKDVRRLVKHLPADELEDR